MALYNAIQERGLNRVLQQRLTMLDSAPAPALVPEIQSALVLESDRPEWRRWKNETYFAHRFQLAGVAGERGSVWLNPGSPNYLIVIEQISNRSAVEVSMGWRTTQPTWSAAAGITNAYTRDNSVASMPLPIPFLSGTSVGAIPFDNSGGAGIDALIVGASMIYPIILWPGRQGLLIRGDVDNSLLNLTIRGYFRPLLPNELG